jgi:SOS-response transcriptional repressor LexA
VLKAENPDYRDIVIDPLRDAVSVEGICVGVIRQELDL